MNQLETLLNTLIARGWKPWGNNNVKSAMFVYTHSGIIFSDKDECVLNGDRFCSLRELVSLESGLWQFCKKNGLCKKDKKYFREKVSKVGNNIGWFEHNYQYRLLESALVPEDKLGQFLLDNIKVEGKKE